MGLQASLGGIRDGLRRVEAVASSIAGPQVRGGSSLAAHQPVAKGIEASVQAAEADSVDISAQAVELLQASHQVGVNAAALGRIADAEQSVLDMLG